MEGRGGVSGTATGGARPTIGSMMTPTADVIHEAGIDRVTGHWPVTRAERRAARRIARATRGRGLWTAAHARKVRGRILAYLGRSPVGYRLAVVSFVVGRSLDRYADGTGGLVDAGTAEMLSAYAVLLRRIAGHRPWHRPLRGGPGGCLHLVEEVRGIGPRGSGRVAFGTTGTRYWAGAAQAVPTTPDGNRLEFMSAED